MPKSTFPTTHTPATSGRVSANICNTEDRMKRDARTIRQAKLRVSATIFYFERNQKQVGPATCTRKDGGVCAEHSEREYKYLGGEYWTWCGARHATSATSVLALPSHTATKTWRRGLTHAYTGERAQCLATSMGRAAPRRQATVAPTRGCAQILAGLAFWTR